MIGLHESHKDGINSNPERLRMPSALAQLEREMPESPSFSEALDDAVQRGYVAAYRWLGSRDEARDACQEAAARALAAKRRYDPNRSFYPWFYRILKNHCLDRLKRRGRNPESVYDDSVSSDSNSAPDAVERAGTADSAEQRLLKNERERAVAAAIAQLPADLREMIELRHFQDLSYREMGELLGCPEGTVMSRLYRARKRLRELLADELAPDRGRSNQRRSS